MSQYATQADMTTRFNHQDLVLLTERDNSTPDHINESVLAQALNDATAEMNGYLSGRYSLPLSHVPTVLTRLCCDIARYFLSGDNAPEHITKRYHDALTFLRSVNKGDVSLGLDTVGNLAKSNDVAMMESAGSVFARDKSKGFI